MPTHSDDELPQLLGPYENWVFGPGGSKSAGLDINSQKPFQIAGVAEVRPKKAAHEPGIMSVALGANDEIPPPKLKKELSEGSYKPEEMVYPTLWWEGLKNTGPSHAHILPCALMFPGNKQRASALEDIKNFLQNLRGSSIMGLGAERVTAEFGYRLNWYFPEHNFDHSFATAKPRPAPELVAEPVMLEKIESKTAGVPPLTIVAVIDDGLPFAHPNLCDKKGIPRTEFCWLQSADVMPHSGTVLFGREHTRSTIAALQEKFGGDEDTLYQEAGAFKMDSSANQPMAHLWSHGAHVFDIVAGHNHTDINTKRPVHATDGDVDRMRLIGVELPSPMVIDTIGFGKDAFILSALHYIFDRADRIAAMYGLKRDEVPLIINFSFGFTGGPHDGSERIEEAIAHLVKTRQALGGETKLVMPSGNDFHGALYGEIGKANLNNASRYPIPWRVQPNDRTANYLEVWYPITPSDAATSAPKPPAISKPSGGDPIPLGTPRMSTLDGAEIGDRKALKQTVWDMKIGSEIIGQVSLDLFRGIRWRLLIVLGPTHDSPLANEVGLWKIEVDGQMLNEIPSDQNAVLACRIQRDNGTRHPGQGGRQSYFDHPGDRYFDDEGSLKQNDDGTSFMRRFGTLNGLATHDAVIVVGGTIKDTGEPANYSSAGNADGTGGVINCTAPSDDSSNMMGQRAAGTRAAATSRLVGTSSAAPQVARGIALAFLDPSITAAMADGTKIKGLVPSKLEHAQRLPIVSNRFGEGNVDH